MYDQLEIVSKNGLICFFLFILFFLSLRVLLPYGDEPDFKYRKVELFQLTEKIPFFIMCV